MAACFQQLSCAPEGVLDPQAVDANPETALVKSKATDSPYLQFDSSVRSPWRRIRELPIHVSQKWKGAPMCAFAVGLRCWLLANLAKVEHYAG